ncbi:GRB10-interacting GYF protein 2 [Macrosteles quadrilineatus]|uniref:GRB10-interacting GYF protein 2 n=1 Tax=Macrosteles quadrilineatus TaxID=74068 RepID=UPI0023E2A334|nr:GRB10-interacting GYF protein 2 [Macrosteles quadrilineatus]
MAMDSMKFGPEWLRNMKSGDSSGGAAQTAPIRMADHRYGREEMLALFNRNVQPPDDIKQLQGLYVKEMQLPLALIPQTQEEITQWNRGINSEGALRLSKPGMGPGGPRGAMGGRGGSVDRGRGRGRGSYHYSRGLSYDESENTNGYPRGRNNYDRSQSGGGWGERNGGDTGDSPRKDFGSRDTNWRRHRLSGGGEEDDGWRASRPSDKWGRGNSNSWREGEGWDRSRPWEETNNSHPPPRKHWEEESNLPEWAMENPSESGGSFDASGAFHGGPVCSDEEEGATNQQRGRTKSEQSKTNTSQPRPTSQTKKEPPNITNGTSPSQDQGAADTVSTKAAPLRLSQSATNLNSERRPPVQAVNPLPHPLSTSASFSGVNSHPSLSSGESKPQREQPVRKPATSPLEQHSAFTNYVPPKPVEEPKPPQKPNHEDEMEQRLLNDADVFVSRLMEEDGEAIPSPSNTSPSHHHASTQSPLPNSNKDISWVYQDPQGEIQGNFLPTEMADWYVLGYFSSSLLVRRTCDEIFLPISEMKKFWKPDKPFEVDYHTLPPIKKNQPHPLIPQTLPAAPPAPALDDAMLLQYQIHQQMLHQRQQAAIFARLRQSEQFNKLSDLEQRQVLAQQTSLAGLEPLQGGMMLPHMQQHPVSAANPTTNSNVIAMLQVLAAQQQQQQQQLQQQRLGAGAVPVLSTPAEPTLDPLQQIMSQIGLHGPTRTAAPPATPQTTPDNQQSFHEFLNSFRQRQAAAVPPPPTQPQAPPVMESVWGAPAFPSWSVPPGHAPATANPPQSLWADPISKGIKTEKDILEEQRRVEEKKKEELRKQEELRLKEEERERLRRIKEEEEMERQRQEEEERERKRALEAEEKMKKEAAAKKEQDRLKKEEEKKRKEEEKRRKEEEKRKQEEEKRKAEEERKRQEEEKKKQEQMAKRQNEALKRMQEQQQAQVRAAKVTPTPAPWTPPDATGPSLVDIQKTERKQVLLSNGCVLRIPPNSLLEKLILQENSFRLQQQLKEQQEKEKRALEKQQQALQQQQLKNSKSASGLLGSLKWADVPNSAPPRVKSLAEIQAEEQERLAKQSEREKAERMAASKEVTIPQANSIWQTASQSLSWSEPTSSVWGGPMPNNSASGAGARFFDDDRNKAAAKPQPQTKPQAKPQTKTKAKKEEAVVKQLFEKHIPKDAKAEEFNKWCNQALHEVLKGECDVPTIIDFLWTLESQDDIVEFCQVYLKEASMALQFASKYMNRRRRLLNNSSQSEMRQETAPSSAQPSNNNFQEVKGKNKKVKKTKMTKVDSRILGFNVTAAPDRINVGDRDYGENI